MPVDPHTMYRWRTWTQEQRQTILKERQQRGNPLHSPPHRVSDGTCLYLITAACFEHRSIIGYSETRLQQFSTWLCDLITESCNKVFAWVVLPNHYHFLAEISELKILISQLGKLHGRTSYEWKWGGFDARSAGMVQSRGDGNEVGRALLRNPQLRLEQPSAPWLLQEVDGLAL